MRRAPAIPRPTVAAAINTSRARTIHTITSTATGMSSTSSAVAPATSNARSAVGSSTLPNSLAWPGTCRAM
jgi:hypothetical protein